MHKIEFGEIFLIQTVGDMDETFVSFWKSSYTWVSVLGPRFHTTGKESLVKQCF